MQDAHVPRRVAKAHGPGGQHQVNDGRRSEIHRAAAFQPVLHPQRQRHQNKKQRNAVFAMGDAGGDGAVARPDQRPGQGQAVTERVVLHVRRHAAQVKALRAAQHPANADDRQPKARHDEPVGPLPVEHDGRHDGETGPQVIDHAHLNRLLRCVRVANRQGQAQLIGHKQHAAPEQVAPGKGPQVARPGTAHRQQQKARGHAVQHGRAARGPQVVADAADQADDGAPQHDGDQANQGGVGWVGHGSFIK